MGISMLQALAVTCDEPACEAEELFDPPHAEARRRARVLGWAITGSKGEGGHVTTLCPSHRRYQRRNWKPASPLPLKTGPLA